MFVTPHQWLAVKMRGIVAYIFGKPKHEPVECDSMYWLRKFEQYKPEGAYVLHCAEDPTGYVVLEFGTEWTGFMQMMKLDRDFLVDHHGKKDYYESRKMGYSSGLFGWCAQAEDYNSEGLVGNFLRQKAELKTTLMVAQESLNEKTETLDHLYGEIGSVNKKISEMESKYIKDYMSLDKMMKEIEKKRDLLHQTRAEDDHVNCAPVLKSMVMRGREINYKAIEKNKTLQQEIDTMNDELDRWCQQLIEQEKSTIQQWRKFEEEKKSMKARNDILSLLEKHQMEKKAVSDALLKLEKKMGNEQKLNLEIAELEGQLKEADHENKRKIEIEEIEEKLEDMIFDMSVKDDENQALEKKVQEAKTELEDARQQVIKLLAIGTVLSQLMFSVQKLIECICLTIQELPRSLKGEVIDENDPKLLSLKNDLEEEAYVAVVTAPKELHEYHNSDDAENTHNSSEKQVIPEIWDYQNGRRATVTEALKYISNRVIKMR
ncbi:Factor of DNA methylation 1 [Glycine max]|nr:Factor of DNA methylation 1 [Glycine max]